MDGELAVEELEKLTERVGKYTFNGTWADDVLTIHRSPSVHGSWLVSFFPLSCTLKWQLTGEG